MNDGKVRILGSSPRVRGTAGALDEEAAVVRFIPACAGNRALSDLVEYQTVLTGSSPRVRGTAASTMLDQLAVYVAGSSPRVRGTGGWERSRFHVAVPRFIPACAGNSTASAARCWVA